MNFSLINYFLLICQCFYLLTMHILCNNMLYFASLSLIMRNLFFVHDPNHIIHICWLLKSFKIIFCSYVNVSIYSPCIFRAIICPSSHFCLSFSTIISVRDPNNITHIFRLLESFFFLIYLCLYLLNMHILRINLSNLTLMSASSHNYFSVCHINNIIHILRLPYSF